MTERKAATPHDPHHCDNPDHQASELTYVHEVETERRHLRFWLIKVMVVMVAVCVVVVVGSAAYSLIIKEGKFEISAIEHLIKVVGEIIDVLE